MCIKYYSAHKAFFEKLISGLESYRDMCIWDRINSGTLLHVGGGGGGGVGVGGLGVCLKTLDPSMILRLPLHG